MTSIRAVMERRFSRQEPHPMSRMLSACRSSLLAFAVLVLTLTQAHAQCNPHNPNPPSPPAQASVSLNGQSVTIDYCAPSMRGRKIFGGLVPYDHWWRTGANTSTTLKTATDLRI